MQHLVGEVARAVSGSPLAAAYKSACCRDDRDLMDAD